MGRVIQCGWESAGQLINDDDVFVGTQGLVFLDAASTRQLDFHLSLIFTPQMSYQLPKSLLNFKLNTRSPASNAPTQNARCQRCLLTGHWTADCPTRAIYKSRPTRSQLLKHPTMKLPESVSKGSGDELQEERRTAAEGHSGGKVTLYSLIITVSFVMIDHLRMMMWIRQKLRLHRTIMEKK